MEPSERHLLTETVREALPRAPGADPGDVDRVLAELGWLDMLETERADAIEIVFRALGEANAVATALDDVIVDALGIQPRSDLAVVLSRFGSWAPPGRVDDGRVRVRGLASARTIAADELLVVCDAGTALKAVIVPARSVAFTAVRGIDADVCLHVID